MQMLIAHPVQQEQDYVSPFDGRALGFRSHWWVDPFQHIRDTSHRAYFFTDVTGAEVARALLRTRAGFTDLEGAGISLPSSAIAVDRIEVRTDLLHPRRGIGTRVIRMLEALHSDETLYAFSEGADDFWRSTGWEFAPRADGSTSYRPLFVLHRN